MNFIPNSNYATQCEDAIKDHVEAAQTDIGIKEFWSAQCHYLRCSGLAVDIKTKNQFETKAVEMQRLAISKMLREDFDRAIQFIQRFPVTDKPIENFTVDEIFEKWKRCSDGQFQMGTFWMAAERIHREQVKKAHKEYDDYREALPEDVVPEPFRYENLRSEGNLKVSEVLDWLRAPPELIPDI